MTTVRLCVDFDKCTGLGICESLAPDFFEVDDDGGLVVHTYEVSDEELSAVETAVEGCPTEALSIVRD